ncbi:MAG: hypothetical protein ACRC9L_06655 [Brevinema sp.]
MSELAESFQKAFPTLSRFSRSNIEDMIFNENSSNAFKDCNKDFLLEGKDLELNFILESRRREFKFDHSAKEYEFTDEDRLAFAINESEFWECFIKADRNIGEYMKETFRNMPSSSLLKSMPMPMTASSSSSDGNRKLMEEIKRNLSGQMVTTNQIAESFFKMMGDSYTSSQVQDLAIKLEKGNGTCRCSANCPCAVLRDKIVQLSCKCFEECYCG